MGDFGFNSAGTTITKGDVADNAPQVNLNPNYVGGRAEDIAALPTFTAGDSAGLRFNKETGAAIVLNRDLTAATDVVTIVETPSTKTTYSVGITGLVIVAAATDFFEISGSATKTVRVKRLQFSGIATAAEAVSVQVLKRSTANTAGTSTTPTIVAHDSTNAAATAVVKAYTANPTTGTLVGSIRNIRPTFTTAAGAIPNIPVTIDFDVTFEQDIILRGIAQSLVLNLNGATVAGLTLDIDATITEE